MNTQIHVLHAMYYIMRTNLMYMNEHPSACIACHVQYDVHQHNVYEC